MNLVLQMAYQGEANQTIRAKLIGTGEGILPKLGIVQYLPKLIPVILSAREIQLVSPLHQFADWSKSSFLIAAQVEANVAIFQETQIILSKLSLLVLTNDRFLIILTPVFGIGSITALESRVGQ